MNEKMNARTPDRHGSRASKRPLMRLRTVVLGFLIAATLVVGFGWPVISALLDSRRHQEHLRDVRETFARYDQTSWKRLAIACDEWAKRSWGSRTQPTQADWPEVVSVLKPVHVSVGDDTIYITWTAGFDDDRVSLEFRQAKDLHRQPQLWLTDTLAEPDERLVYGDP